MTFRDTPRIGAPGNSPPGIGAPVPPAQKPGSVRPRFGTLRSVAALVLREMATSYGRSPGGYAWAVLEPVLAIALLSFIFSLAFRAPAIGVNFPIFYATGMLPYYLFIDINGKIATSLMFSKPLLAYPRVTFIDAIAARLIVGAVTQLMVSYIVFTGILLLFETRTDPVVADIALAFAMAAILGLGVGTLNCFLFSMFPLWQRAWGILTRPLVILSCVLFIFDAVPQPYRDILWFNPLVHVIGQMRHGFYASYDALYVAPLYVFGVALVLLLVGLVFLRRYHRFLLHE